MKITLRPPHLMLPITLLTCVFAVHAATPESETAGKLDKRLAPIAAAAARHLEAPLRDAALARAAARAASPFEPHWNAAGQVQVYLHYGKYGAAPDREQLQALGATEIVDSPSLGVIQAWVPAGQLDAIGGLPGVLRVGLPRYALHKQAPLQRPVTYTGSVETQGDSILGAAEFRKTTGDTGQGVTVGVISDGDQHIADSQKSGDLPNNIWNDPKDAGGSGGFSPVSSGDEGTAMMEIVYDIAPGVNRLGFCGPQTTVDFVTCLNDFKANISSNVIVDDLGFPGGAMFSQDTFTSGVQSFAQANPNIHLVTAAGNDGSGFWEGTYTTPVTVSTTANGVSYTQALDFGGGNRDLQINARAGDTLGYIVEWDDPWSDTTTTNDPNDFDVVVFSGPGGTGTAVACNQGINIGPSPSSSSTSCNEAKSSSLTSPGPQPVQGSQWTATSSTYYLEVFAVNGSLVGKRLKVLVFDQSARQVMVSPSTSGSIQGQSALPGEITVGAVDPGSLQLESFSSTGPVWTGTGGTQSSVQKPDFVGPDCVFITGAGGFATPFCGTSAAAPHIAGLVALLVSGYPGKSPYTLLQQSATPKGSPTPNGDYGYGLPNMQTLLNNGQKPTPRPAKSGGGGDMDLLVLLLLGLAAGLKRKRG